MSNDEVERLERKADQIQHLLDGLREDLQSLRYWRGPKDAMARRSRNSVDIRAEMNQIAVPDVHEDE